MTTSVRDFARPAIDDQPTRRAFRRYVLRCVRAAALGFVSLVLAVVVVNVSPGHNPGGLAVLAAVLGFSGGGVAFAIGVGSLLRSIRMRIVLGHHPWVMRSSRYRIAAADRSNGQPALVINEFRRSTRGRLLSFGHRLAVPETTSRHRPTGPRGGQSTEVGSRRTS